jgi:hypothetical protein
MSYLPGKLREHAEWAEHGALVCGTMRDAADEIERLERLVDMAKAELSKLNKPAIFDREIYALLGINLGR